ncbi:MAG TPA: pyridoxal phosphate-dependent aminotransferase family protein [Candidatus Sulfopaludibacter sp.]|nr:pyridoxal phosphate-dependent aminotransferase family protein [Candidatus Sulfopaludibacter sp.]
MRSFDAELWQRLDAICGQGLLRELRRVDSPQGTRLRVGGQPLLTFASNDYLGLANDPVIREAAIKAVEKFGAGAGAARLICGSLAPHHELEEALARFKGVEAALSFSSGYATAVGTIGALLAKDDIIILDKLVHACIVDAARLSGAKIRVFAHNDLDDLESKLKWANGRVALHEPQTSTPTISGTRVTRPSGQKNNVLVVTESIFSMDGDAAPLREIVGLKEKYGAWLMVDEAHATGLYGKHRRGLAEELGVSDNIEIQMGTLGKALGASGGYISGSRPLIDFLVNRARSFIFSTAPVPAAAAAARAAIEFVESAQGELRRQSLWARVSEFQSHLTSRQSPILSAIIPFIVGDEARAVEAAARLRDRNIFVPAVRYPTVARGQARLRVSITAAHTPEDITGLMRALETLDFGFKPSTP